jgi:hypothetical protein
MGPGFKYFSTNNKVLMGAKEEIKAGIYIRLISLYTVRIHTHTHTHTERQANKKTAGSSAAIRFLTYYSINHQLFVLSFLAGLFSRTIKGTDDRRHAVAIEELCYKPEGREFDTRRGEFLNLPNPSGRTRP